MFIRILTESFRLILPYFTLDLMLINLFQRHYLWVFLLLSALLGLATGNLGATFFGLLNAPDVKTSVRVQETPNIATPKIKLDNYQPIISRNIFNSAQSLQPSRTLSENENRPAATTSSKWTLIGTVSGGLVPLATLQEGGNTATYALDEELPDGAVLVSIERNRVELRYAAGRIVILELVSNEATPARQPTRPIKKAANADRLVNELGENRWQISALAAEDARSNIGELLKQAQAIPYLENEQTTGFQIKMIQRGSLIAQLGLRRGDILRKVNGVSLNSPEKALQIFGQLRQAKNISIDLERRGKALSFAYEIR